MDAAKDEWLSQMNFMSTEGLMDSVVGLSNTIVHIMLTNSID